MRTHLYAFTLLLTLCLMTGRLFAQNATNPIIYADVPDPDFVRVGDTYYMSSTTMYFNPGVPIMKSKDLVNWELVNYCYPIMASTDALNLNNGMEAYSGGTWASSINYYKGTFYVSSFSYSTNRTYIYKTTNIETGPWTTITLNKVYHDHSLFFDDDGKVYFAYGHDNIQLTEMKPDLTGEQPGGVNKIIINKASGVAGSSFILTAEGTRIQKINGTYYVSNICWPSGKGRTQILHKSSTIGGTYTGRVVFQSSIGSAQGEYIDRPDGKWYAMFFHDHGALGRIPDLMPVTWGADGWPTVGVNGQVPATLDIPKGAGTLKGIVDSDEFSAAPPLKLQWQWNHNPNNTYWSLTQKSGYLRLTNERTDANVLRTTNTLTQRTFGPKCSGYVALDVSGMKDGDYAGLLALQNKYGFVGVKMSGTAKTIVMGNGTGFSGTTAESGNIALNQNTVYLRIDFDFTNRTDKAYFYYSLNGTNWTAIGSTLQMNYDLEHFVGYRFGLFSYATKSSGGYADFDFFRVGANITEAQNVGPNVAFTSPASNAAYPAGTAIPLEATASSPNGVANVKFYDGTTLLTTDNSVPYSFSLANAAQGPHTLKAVVTDNAGKTAEATVSIKVSVPQGAYNGTPHVIPGTIQAEHFDVGGNGIAYNDDTPGSEVTPIVNFRTDEDVDIEACTDAGAGYNLGWATTGEWWEYTVNVAATTTYTMDLRVACNGDSRTVSIAVDGANVGGAIPIPNTGGWQAWTSTSVNVPLTAGQHVLRLSVGAQSYVNINYMTFGLITSLDKTDIDLVPSVYPNPFEHTFKLQCFGKFGYKLYDLSGRLVLHGAGSGEITIGENLQQGIYLLEMVNEGKVHMTKIHKK